MSAADDLLQRLRVEAQSAQTAYYRLKSESLDDFGPNQRKALQAWASASDVAYGASLMLAVVREMEPTP